MGALLGQSDYERNLTDSIDMLRFRSSQFEKVAQICCLEVVEHTKTNVQALRADTLQNNTELHRHLDIIRMGSYEQYESLENSISQVLQMVIELLNSNPRLDRSTQDLSRELDQRRR
jgi:NAD-specific glutamate dehydrogenase